ncbi:MAG: hypothetical protein MUE67_08790 [Anaerolineales bacterium]|jgi:serine/threonine protein kinase|nr:hypothetical protein [Anaerolineales bacterium]
MNTTLSAIGRAKSWSLLSRLGEGDAGEVFLVESLLDRKQAILKRPRKSAFSSEIIRQASQIENEGRILEALKGLRPILPRKTDLPRIQVRTPELIDQSQPGTEFSDRFFIVVEKAPGIALSALERQIHFGDLAKDYQEDDLQPFFQWAGASEEFPALVITSALAGVLYLFEAIHNYTGIGQADGKSGIIWNDVKTDHIFWDPRSASLTIIDWGNAQFLEADGFSKDRRLSKIDDYTQFFRTFKAFLTENKPDYLDLLKWPVNTTTVLSLVDLARPLKKILGELHQEQSNTLKNVRQQEAELVSSQLPDLSALQQLIELQQSILASGDLPDYPGAERFCSQMAARMMQEGKLAEFADLSQVTCQVHSNNLTKWEALKDIAQAGKQAEEGAQPGFLQAISAGLVDDWAAALWSLLTAVADQPEPEWWDEVCGLIRQVGLGIEADQLPPLIVLRRQTLLMQSVLQKMQVQSANNDKEAERRNQVFQSLIKTIKEEIIPKWSETEPDPPDSSLAYQDIERLLTDMAVFSPESQRALVSALSQPGNQVNSILEAWQAAEFDSARRGLRRLLLWDPDRRRVLLADRAITRTPKWLEKIRSGPQNGQSLVDFITSVEFGGRELRNQVGSAEWLDRLLEIFAQIRKGRRPGDLLVEQPELAGYLPWVELLEPRRYVQTQPGRAIPLERQPARLSADLELRGSQEALLGPGKDLLLADPLDTWAPEARGSSARTFTGFVRNQAGQVKQIAIKIMRENRLEYALPLFREEVVVLSRMNDVPGVVPLLECGFIHLNTVTQLPPDNRPLSGRELTGEVQRFGPDQAAAFLSILDTRAHQGWLPYVGLPKLDNTENLMWICDAGLTRGRFLPVEESLRLALQICDILKISHERSIVYRDHKLLHYYWSELYNGVFMIDWNVARYHPAGLSPAEIQFDLVQLGARALHHIFTGRVAPGALADGPNRVEEIESAAKDYRAQWTYDDQRIPPAVKNILEQLLAASYNSVSALQADLAQAYQELVGDNRTSEDSSKN